MPEFLHAADLDFLSSGTKKKVKVKDKAIPLQAWTDPWGFQEVEASRFQDSRHMKAVR